MKQRNGVDVHGHERDDPTSTKQDGQRRDQLDGSWLARWTTLRQVSRSLSDEPSGRFEAWARTTAWVVAMLLALQIVTGVLLAFYYVPYTEGAHTTVAYIEKVVPAGSWIRALHHYGSQWLPLALVLHLAQMFWHASYRRRPVGWIACVCLLALALADGATGYSLPWDVRAFFSTRVTEGIAGGLPLIGSASRKWLLGGTEISPLTLTRFYALHTLVVPALILLTVAARLFVFRDPAQLSALTSHNIKQSTGSYRSAQTTRNAVVIGAVFLALALYAARFHAPLGPPASVAAPGYLPRPGAQFLWLFQMLKYLPGRAASLIAVALPGLILAALAALPFLDRPSPRNESGDARRKFCTALFALCFALVTGLTLIAYIGDARDTRVRAQLARQATEETSFRAAPFMPLRATTSASTGVDSEMRGRVNEETPRKGESSNGVASPQATMVAGSQNSVSAPPDSYTKNCSACHGTRGQGFSIFPKLTGVSAKPQRTVEDLIAILNDPAAYGLRPPMKSYGDKLSESEKREIAEWVASLRKDERQEGTKGRGQRSKR